MGLRKPRAGNAKYGRLGHPCLPVPGYCMSLKDFCPVGNEKSLFVILLSNLNGWFSTKCHLFVRIFQRLGTGGLYCVTKFVNCFFLRSSVVRVWEFFLKNSDKNKTEREYVSKLEFQKSNHCLVCPISSPEPLDFMWPRAETTGTGDMNGSCTWCSVLKPKSMRMCKLFVSSPLHI